MRESLVPGEHPAQLAALFTQVLEAGWARTDRKVLPEVFRLLRQAHITSFFRDDIRRKLQQVLSDEERKRALGIGYIVNICGIDLQGLNYGIFDPSTAYDVERRQLEKEYQNLELMVIPDLIDDKRRVLDLWKRALDQMHQ